MTSTVLKYSDIRFMGMNFPVDVRVIDSFAVTLLLMQCHTNSIEPGNRLMVDDSGAL
jgi:hypothetical protein